jgi:hypothetical protein
MKNMIIYPPDEPNPLEGFLGIALGGLAGIISFFIFIIVKYLT